MNGSNMTNTRIENLSQVQIDWAIGRYVLGWLDIECVGKADRSYAVAKPNQTWAVFAPTHRWADLGHFMEKHSIGVEGNSAWAWRSGKCVGYTGSSPNMAVGRTLLAVVTQRPSLEVPQP